jgi:HEAT repeat protein
MFLIGTILALTLVAPQDGDAFPKPLDDQPPAAFADWSGFGYAPAQNRTFPNKFEGPGDWSAVQAAANHPPDPNAAVWRLRIFIIKRLDRLNVMPDGTVFEQQSALETPDMDRIFRSINQLQALVSLQTHGRLRLQVDTSTETDPVLAGRDTIKKTLADYVYPRFNGGAYEADDGVFRGPYQSVMCIHPGFGTQTLYDFLNETPTSFVPAFNPPRYSYDSDGIFTLALDHVWLTQVRQLSSRSGVAGTISADVIDPVTGLRNPFQFVPNQDWRALEQGPDLAADLIEANLKLPVLPEAKVQEQPKLFINTYRGAFTQARIATDSEKGSVLIYDERGSARAGGLDLPMADIKTADTPTLSFWCKSASQDPLALFIDTGDPVGQEVCLGRDIPGDFNTPQADFIRDGQWHQVKIDLSAWPSIRGFGLAPTTNGMAHPKITLGPVEYSFADFQLSKDPAPALLGPIQPDPDSPDSVSRAMWAAHADPSAKLAALLKDPDWSVRLNAIGRYIQKPDPSLEPVLTDNVSSAIDGSVNAAALDALWALGTDSAKETVRHAILTDITELGKAEAARLCASTKDPTLAEPLITLSQSRTLGTRIADVDALAQLPGSTPALIRMSLLAQDDPQLKLEITRTSDPADSYQVGKLLWSAVNETSDAVRAASDLLLIKSSDPKAKDQGYRGVKDDSVNVRLILLREFATHPDEDQRNAIRIAVTDRSARVRAAALAAFAALPKDVTLDELGTVTSDRHPVVELALIDLVKKKGVKLPTDSISQIKNSSDPDVRRAAEGVL